MDVSASPQGRVSGNRYDGQSLVRLASVVGVALFTTLIMHRVTPQQLSAGATPAEHVLPDGTRLLLRPGSTVNVVRDFSLWGGVGARPRLVRWVRGGGQVVLSPQSMAFYIVTPDAELNVSEGTVDIELGANLGTRIRATGGRPTITVRDRGEAGGLMASRGTPTIAEPGEVVEVRNGALDVNEDVAGEDTVVRPGMPSGG